MFNFKPVTPVHGQVKRSEAFFGVNEEENLEFKDVKMNNRYILERHSENLRKPSDLPERLASIREVDIYLANFKMLKLFAEAIRIYAHPRHFPKIMESEQNTEVKDMLDRVYRIYKKLDLDATIAYTKQT